MSATPDFEPEVRATMGALGFDTGLDAVDIAVITRLLQLTWAQGRASGLAEAHAIWANRTIDALVPFAPPPAAPVEGEG